MKNKDVANGGKREGAGRPPLYGKKAEQVAVTMPPELAANLRCLAKRQKISRSALIVELIRAAMASNERGADADE